MYILGISAYFHDSSAALLKDGQIIAAVQEERYTRIKNDSSFPINSIKFCLDEANISLNDVSYITYYEKPFLKFERLIESFIQTVPFSYKSFRKSLPIWLNEKLFTKNIIKKELRRLENLTDEEFEKKIRFSEHHLSHLASSYYPSTFTNAALISIDAVGESTTTSIAQGENNQIKILDEIAYPNSLGLLYSAFTYFLGFKVNEGEYKVMGLAPYGKPVFKDLIFDKLIKLNDDGSFKLNLKYFNFHTGLTMTNKKFEVLFGIKRRGPNEELNITHMNIAASIQETLNTCVLKIVERAKAITGSKNLCLSGGVALNCVTNEIIANSNIFENIWVQPASGDAGSSLGAALVTHHIELERPLIRIEGNQTDHMKNALLGPSYNDDEVSLQLQNSGLDFHKIDNEADLIDTIVTEILEGKVIGLHRGKLEFGPRALGNRSIIADPRIPDIQSRLNLKIKFRESFRPFAPVILEEDLKDWYEIKARSPYMLFTAKLKKEHRGYDGLNYTGLEMLKNIDSKVPGVTHVDYSSRIQTVNQQSNLFLYKLLNKFKEQTACPMLINTSFNRNREPIVCSPKDSIECFKNTNMDLLIIENYLVKKSTK